MSCLVLSVTSKAIKDPMVSVAVPYTVRPADLTEYLQELTDVLAKSEPELKVSDLSWDISYE